MHKLIVFGSARVDAFMQLPADQTSQLCNLDTNKCVIELTYSAKLPLTQVDFLTGGNGANVAVGTKRLGVESTLVCELGEGMLAEKVMSDLGKEINTEFISQTKGVRQGFGAVINYQGERTILSYYAPERPKFPHHLEASEWAYLTSVGDNFEEFYEDVYTWLSNNPSVKLAFNPGGRQIAKGPEWMKRFLEKTTLLLANREETEAIVGMSKTHGKEKELLDACTDLGVVTPIVTDGRSGSFAKHEGKYYKVGILPIDAVERTGAGDSYSTASLSALIKGKSMEEAMLWGTINSASVIGFIGPEDGLLTLDAMENEWVPRAASSEVKVETF